MGFEPGGDKFDVRLGVVYGHHKIDGLFQGCPKVETIIPEKFVSDGPSGAFVSVGKRVV